MLESPLPPARPPNVAGYSAFFPNLCTYNVNSLSQYATQPTGRRRRSLIHKNLLHLSKSNHILCIQESKLRHYDDGALRGLFPGWRFFYSNFPDIDSRRAGVITLVSPDLNNFDCSLLPLADCCNGHAVAVRLTDPSARFRPFAVINLYLPQRAADKIDVLRAVSGLALPDDVFVTGDFNFVERPEDANSPSNYALSGTLATTWATFCDKLRLTEVSQDTHTFIRSVEGEVVSARLDRVYTSLSLVDLAIAAPSSFIPNVPHSILPRLLTPQVRVACPDHVPVALKFSLADSLASKNINFAPRWMVGLPEFKAKLQHAVVGLFTGGDPFVELAAFKTTFFSVVSDFKHEARTTQASSALAKVTIGVTLLRALSARPQNSQYISKLFRKHLFLAPLVSRHGSEWDCSALRRMITECLADGILPSSFHEPTEFHFGAHFSCGPVAKTPNIISDIKMRLPSDRARLPGLRRSLSDELATDPVAMADITSDFFSKIWAARPEASDVLVEQYFDKVGYRKSIPPSLLPCIPSVDVILDIILSTNNSCAGPDGVPFEAYRAVADQLAPVFHAAILLMGLGALPPEGFNDGLLFLLSKKGSLTPDDTRPLSVTNCDNRIIAKIVVFSIIPAVQKVLNIAQQGFVPGRSGDVHIQALLTNFYLAVQTPGSNYHVLQIDTKKAFDSVDHQFVLGALRRIGFPEWVVGVVKGLLSNVRVTPFFGTRVDTWIAILRGVKQGCPLSPLLFVICYDVLLCDIKNHAPSLDLFAFADDMALGCYRRGLFAPAMLRIDFFGFASGFGVNYDKTRFLSAKGSHQNDVLWARSTPWKVLLVALASSYLGVLYGRQVTTLLIFEPVFIKGIGRLSKFHAALRCMSFTRRVLAVNVFICSLFSYLIQYFPIPFPEQGVTATSLYGRYMAALRRAIIPFNSSASKYIHFVGPGHRFGAASPVRDLWAWSTATLAAKADLGPFQGMPKSNFVDSKGLGLHGKSTSLAVTDSFSNAARDFIIALFIYFPDLHSFDGLALSLLSPLKRRASIYNSLIMCGYFQDQDSDLAEKLVRRGAASSLADCLPLVPLIHRNFSFLAKSRTRLGHFTFALITNSIPTERRRMVIQFPNKMIRDAAPRLPCFICGLADDGSEHVHGSCTPVLLARTTFFNTILIPPPSCSPWLAALLAFDCSDKEVVLALTSFNISVRSAVANFFRYGLVSASSASSRILQIALSEWFSLGAVARGFGSAGKCTPSQCALAHAYCDRVLGVFPTDTVLIFSAGCACPSPGASGAGMCIPTADPLLPSPDASVPLGRAGVLICELWGVGAALQHGLSLVSSGQLSLDHSVVISSASRLALQSVGGMRRSGELRWLISPIRSLISQLSSLCHLHLIWIPGHIGYPGLSRAADLAAQAASNTVGIGTDLLARAAALDFR